MDVSIFVMSAMSRSQIQGAIRQRTDLQCRNRVDYSLPLELFMLANL